MNLVLQLISICLLAWLIRRFSKLQKPQERRVFWSALALKLIAGVALGWLYFSHYGNGDTISFWMDGNRLAAFLVESPSRTLLFYWDEASVPELINALEQQTPRSLFFVKICGLLSLISGGSYVIMAAMLSTASFAGSWWLYLRISSLFTDARPAAAIALLFFPSVIFWSSGLIKESLGLAALCMLFAASLSVLQGERVGWMEWAVVLLSLWIGWNLKYYWIGIFLPCILPALFIAIGARRFPLLAKYDVWMWPVLFTAFLILATNVHPNFYASRFLEVIYHNNLEFTRMSEPPRIVQYLNLEPELTSILMNAPAALIAGLFRPFIWESFNPLSAAAALENLLLMILVTQAIVAAGQLARSKDRVLFLSVLTYALLLITFLALSTPNFGTLSRYRIGALPAFMMMCLLPGTPVGKWLATRKWFG